MNTVKILSNDKVVAQTILLADNYFARLKGLMFCNNLDNSDGLILKPCNQIHTFFMKFDIDAVFINSLGEVLHIEENMKPSKISKYIKKGKQVLELASGQAHKNNIQVGDHLVIIPSNSNYTTKKSGGI
jgi:uncharacterized membrane protein (UPF0127 family)